ncbi:MAG: DUF2207 domain-containing protein [Bacteroidales bacterium]|nr:DUF2207 domain-containing protein [Bacteroidales bacterium]
MRRFLISALLLLMAAAAAANEVNDILVRVRLLKNGDALVQERWDIDADDGTEWYLVRSGLDGSVIKDLTVSEGGRVYQDDGEWDTDRSRRQKSFHSGIIHKSDGVELCWGIGDYGHHVYEVSYVLTCAVRALDDADYFHWQLVSPGLSSSPEHVKAVIEAEDFRMDSESSRVWGFGYDGTVEFADGTAVFESAGRYSRNSSLIALLRFEKGLFAPDMSEKTTFDAIYQRAMEGASFDDDEDGSNDGIAGFLAFLTMLIFSLPFLIGTKKSLNSSGYLLTRRDKKKMLGVYPNEVDWWRDLPFDGDLYQTEYVMKRLGEIRKENTMAAALILRMIYNGQLVVGKDANDKIEISFGDGSKCKDMDDASRKLYDMMKDASGSDRVLQEREFSRWSSKSSSQKRIREWASGFEQKAKEDLKGAGFLSGTKFTTAGQAKAREAFGFKKFLEDFTLVREKASVEVHMWQEYLVYASLFGIAEKVAKELKDIDTRVYDQVAVFNSLSTYEIMRMTDALSRSITNARYVSSGSYSSYSGSRGGFGGHSSFGGGGGFHGGGFGGGAR